MFVHLCLHLDFAKEAKNPCLKRVSRKTSCYEIKTSSLSTKPARDMDKTTLPADIVIIHQKIKGKYAHTLEASSFSISRQYVNALNIFMTINLFI